MTKIVIDEKRLAKQMQASWYLTLRLNYSHPRSQTSLLETSRYLLTLLLRLTFCPQVKISLSLPPLSLHRLTTSCLFTLVVVLWPVPW